MISLLHTGLLLVPPLRYNESESGGRSVVSASLQPQGPQVRGILQARILERTLAFLFSRGFSQPRDQTRVSHIAGGFFTS